MRIERIGRILAGEVDGTAVIRPRERATVPPPAARLRSHSPPTNPGRFSAPARAIQELAGHADITTTQRYMHRSPAALDQAIKLLEGPGREFRGDMGETRQA